MELKENEKLVNADSEKLTYSGRIDFTDAAAPIFIFPGSSVTMSFTGGLLKVYVKNKHGYHDNYLGYIIDGVQKKLLLSKDGSIQEITLENHLPQDKPHEVTLFKRQDGCHEFTFYGFVISEEGEVCAPARKPRRCMEFYGESAAAGELIEAADCADISECNHNGEYSNAWNSYAMMTARNLKARARIIAQTGIALLDNTGYFHAPNLMGLKSIYDKLHFNPDLGEVTNWNFGEYVPQVVVIDIGQNDSVPEDYMKTDKDGERAKAWRESYRNFVLDIRRKYPQAYIILTTTVMSHHASWDRAIGQICRSIDDEKILHFLYSCNGRVPCGQKRAWAAELMSYELSVFIKGLEPGIWGV